MSTNRRPKTEDRRPKSAKTLFFDAKNIESIRSSFCSFTGLKLQNEDLTLKRFI